MLHCAPVEVQTFIGKMKAMISELEGQLHQGGLCYRDHSHKHSYRHDHLPSATDELGHQTQSLRA
jgi:hypothetical protein